MRAVNLLPSERKTEAGGPGEGQRQRRAHDDARRDRRRQPRGDRRSASSATRSSAHAATSPTSATPLPRSSGRSTRLAARRPPRSSSTSSRPPRRALVRRQGPARHVQRRLGAADPVGLLLSDVSRVIPEGSWLSSLTLQGSPPTAAPAAQQTTHDPAAADDADRLRRVGLRALAGAGRPAAAAARARADALRHHAAAQRARDVGTDKAFQFTLSANVRLDRVS